MAFGDDFHARSFQRSVNYLPTSEKNADIFNSLAQPNESESTVKGKKYEPTQH